MLAHKSHRLYLFIAIEIFFRVINSCQWVARELKASMGSRRHRRAALLLLVVKCKLVNYFLW